MTTETNAPLPIRERRRGGTSGTALRAALALAGLGILAAPAAQGHTPQAARCGAILPAHRPQGSPVMAAKGRREQGIGLTSEQVMAKLKNDFDMEDSVPMRGHPRLLGQTADKLTILEVIGEPDDILETTLVAAMPSDDKDKVYRNLMLMLQFLHNTAPGWTGSNAWFAQSMKAVLKKPGSRRSIVHGGRRYVLANAAPIGIALKVDNPNAK